MGQCEQTTNHYLNQRWLLLLIHTRPQWHNRRKNYQDFCRITFQGLYSLCGRMFYHKILWRFARFEFRLFQLLWKCCRDACQIQSHTTTMKSNLESSRLRSCRLVNRGPVFNSTPDNTVHPMNYAHCSHFCCLELAKFNYINQGYFACFGVNLRLSLYNWSNPMAMGKWIPPIHEIPWKYKAQNI